MVYDIKKTKSYKESIIAKCIFILLHLSIYILLTFKSTTILNEAWRNGEYFYLIWTHCLFFIALFSYLYAASRKPGFIPTSEELKLSSNNNNNNNNNNSNNSYNYNNNNDNDSINNDIDQELETFENNLSLKKPLLHDNDDNDRFNQDDNDNEEREQEQEQEIIKDEKNILYLQKQQKDINELDNINDILNINKKRRTTSTIRTQYHENTKIEKFYCKFCKIYVPLRSKHCRSCERCIYKFDHHCVFIGACIGLENHKSFWSFLLAEALLLALGFRIIISGYLYAPTLKDWVWINITIIPPTLLILGGICMPLALFCFHTYLILTNQTSWEFTKYTTINFLKIYARRGLNPFSKGVWTNFKEFLFDLEKPSDWKLPSEEEFEKWKKKTENSNSFNLWNNKYYSCCG